MGRVATKKYVLLPQCSRLLFVFQTSPMKGEDGIITRHSFMMKRTAGKSLITSCICITLTLKHTMTLLYLTHSITEFVCAVYMTFIYEWIGLFRSGQSVEAATIRSHILLLLFRPNGSEQSVEAATIRSHILLLLFRPNGSEQFFLVSVFPNIGILLHLEENSS